MSSPQSSFSLHPAVRQLLLRKSDDDKKGPVTKMDDMNVLTSVINTAGSSNIVLPNYGVIPINPSSSSTPVVGTSVAAVKGGTSATLVTSSKSGRGAKDRAAGKSEKTFSNAESLPHFVFTENKLANQIWTHIENSVVTPFATTSNAGLTYGEFTIQLSAQVNDYASLISVFDQYRCIRCQLWMVPRVGPAQISATANVGLATSIVDYDDASAPTYAQLLEYRNALTAPGAQGHYRDWKPHIAMATYAGAFTSFANVEDMWIDCASSGVYYYGFKAGFEATDAAYVYDLIVRTTWEFRNQR